MSGRWLHRQSKSALFYVPDFVKREELDELRPYLPTADVPHSMQDILHSMPQIVPRHIGQPLIRKMLNFWTASDAAYQSAAYILDNAHKYAAYPDRFRYAGLEEIADLLLPKSTARKQDGRFPYPVLYAVHRSLLIDGLGFRPQVRGTLRAGGQYEISSTKEIGTIESVRNVVRAYIEDGMTTKANTRYSRPRALQRFVTKARRLIDLSRKTRKFTAHGAIGPSSVKAKGGKFVVLGQEEEFDSADVSIIRFLESWAALRSIGAHSSLNGIGSIILRAVDRYEGVDLDQATAWTFLQEIGAIAPWQNRAAYEMRVPEVGRHLPAGPALGSQDFVADRLQDIRHDWGDLPVYCIDDPSAHEIDDGISIEATNTPDEYWVHVHTADPAAHMDPKGRAAKYAETLIENIYMPERVVSMLASDFVQSTLSLAPNRPSLTFSARMNTSGDLLDYKVTPGTVRNVQFISPRVLREVVEGSVPASKETVRVVGSHMPPVSASRRMLASHEIADSDKEKLRLLHAIGAARAEQRKARGGVTSGQAGFSVSVSFNGPLPAGKQSAGLCLRYYGDPTIQVSSEDMDNAAKDLPQAGNFRTVESFMLIAGEVAARWCNDRGIPIVYRVTPRNLDKPNPADFFVQNVLPTMDEQGKVDPSQEMAYIQLLGAVQPSTTPGPHATMGLDMFARCTSPLRRYGDLLLHWQVESALLEEARLGRSLVGNTKDDFLPFTRAQVDALLPRLDTRERVIAYGKRASNRHWLCLFLLRAWKFKEAKIPSKFPFVVRGVDHVNGNILGVMGTFLAGATCAMPTWASPADFRPGDKLEVELADVNVYQQHIFVKALRRLDSAESGTL